MPEQGDAREDLIPRPDPTVLTTAALALAVRTLEEKLMLRIDGVIQTFAARLDAMDKAQTIFEAGLNRVPTDVTKEVAHLRDLQDEKFLGIQQQFTERDVRSEASARDSKVAVDAALQAAKEAAAEQARSAALATGKSETAQMKAIEQQGAIIQTATMATDSKIADIKDRLTRIESVALGQSGQKQEIHQYASLVVAAIAALIALAAILVRFVH